MATHSCNNYEIVSIAERNRLLLSVDVSDLPHGSPANIVGARMEAHDLLLECRGQGEEAYHLRFPGIPDLDAERLQTYQASLCGMEGGSVAFAKAFAAPRPTAQVKIR